MHKLGELLLGTMIGYIGYIYADKPSHGSYQIGLHPYIEYGGILFYAFQSTEPMSTILLQAISGWHLAAVLK